MALQEDDVIIPNLNAPSDHDEKSDEESNYDKDDVPLSPKQHRKIDPGFLPNNVVLVIEDEHLHVNKTLLESASPIFEAWLKKECQKDECTDDTKRELKFPEKTYDDMVTFLKCLLPNFADKVTDKTLDTVLPLADEYRSEKMITECVEVIRQRVESVSEVDIYIPQSRIVTYLLWIEKYNLQTVKEVVVKLASCLSGEVLEAEPGYENIGLTLQKEIFTTRAKLLASLFVSNVTEAKERIYKLKLPCSSYYLTEWKQNVAKLVQHALASPISEMSTWPKTIAYRKRLRSGQYHVCSDISDDIFASFACLDICDRLNNFASIAIAKKRIKLLKIGKADFKFIWSKYYSTDSSNTNATMERLSQVFE